MLPADDARWLDATAALAIRARPASAPNPAVAAIILKSGIVLGRGWTAASGPPMQRPQHSSKQAKLRAGRQCM